ncbi:Alpha-D-kanosaminyltransferase [Phycisphaerales bacterium]|nr:Alpha-D-kanosaminyltransferase [Phycisphaerales bacterium]
MLIALPSGLIVSGVAAWAARLVNALSARGRACGLILHAPVPGHQGLAMRIDPRVRRFDLSSLPPLEDAAGGLEPYLPHYRAAVDSMLHACSPVVLSPNLLGDCYGLAAALSREFGDRLRIVGWLHNDIPYEYHVQKHYEPLISRFVPVSRRLEEGIRAALPERAADITRIPYGVEVPASLPSRAPAAGRPLRLLYAGRMDHAQKRVLAVVAMSDALSSKGISHELAMVGDGPAAPDVDRAIRGHSAIIRLSAKSPDQVLGLLASADIAVLASRHEGLSIAVIEAMCRGCVPVITQTASGAAELIENGTSGVLVEVPAGEPTDAQVGEALADGVVRASAALPTMSAAAHAAARDRYSINAHADAVVRLLDSLATSPARSWPAERPCEFAGPGGGSVPPDGAAQLSRLLDSLRNRRIVLHGTGRHTLELRAVIEGHLARSGGAGIVAFTDDDPAQQGASLWGAPILAPDRAAETHCTDAVISSWINQDAIWARRSVYEQQGLRVHRIYEA